MLDRFKKFVDQHHLFSPDEKILLAVSGGVDSAVLCELFHRASFSFGMAHVNFKLRGEESEGDALFVKQLAKKYKIPFYCKTLPATAFAGEKNISIQMAARELRYRWLETVRSQEGYSAVATAHHLTDQVETVLINLVRGTGIAGLHGILPGQSGLIRPLLFASREEVEAFALENRLPSREDSSNNSLKYVRNKIRHKVLPVLREINPALEAGIASTVENIKEAEHIFRQAINEKRKEIVKKEKNRVLLSVAGLKKLPRVYLFEFLSEYGFNSAVVREIAGSLGAVSGKQFYSPSHRLVKDRHFLIVEKLKAETKDEMVIGDAVSGIEKPLAMALRKMQRPAGFSIPVLPSVACFDRDRLQFPLKLRKWRKGDHFFPLGMRKKKKLSDFFTDNKLSLFDKENTWLLLSGEDIAWVVGRRVDDRFKVTGKTKSLLICELRQ